MLEPHLKIQAESSSCSTSGASKTLAAARTSTGHLIQVSLRLTVPPGVSRVCLQIPAGLDATYSRVVAAHGDSVLIEVPHGHGHTTDSFVYSAGDAAAETPRPPSLSLQPPSRLGRPTSLVSHGEDLVVPVGVGDGLLCWVDPYELGVVLCDVFEETPRLQYLPLPMENTWGLPSNWNVCATAGGDALKFVNIFHRCCCGGAGASSCERSCDAYTIETWTMRIGNGDKEWAKDSIIDSSELWALDSYKGLRCFPLDHPVVSMDQPELIFFWLYQMGDGLIPSNVSYFFNSCLSGGSDAAFTGQRQGDLERPPPVIVDEQLIIEDDDGSNPATLASFAEPSVQASEIFEAFQEIPSYGLDHMMS